MCCWTSMLKFPSAIMLKRTLEFTMFLLVSITWFPRVVIAPPVASCYLFWLCEVPFRKGDFFSPTSLKAFNDFFLEFRSLSYEIETFFLKRWVLLSFKIFSFSLSMAFAFLGSFVIIFRILSRRVYETEREAWPNNKITCSTKFRNLSTVTSTVSSDGDYGCLLTLFISGIKGPLLPWNLSIWWSDVILVCEDNNDLIKSSRGFTCWRFDGNFMK